MNVRPDLATPRMIDDCLADGQFLSPQDGLDVVLALTSEIAGTELVQVSSSLGRISACDVRSAVQLPRFDNSAMDGFGLHADDIGRPLPLTLALDGMVAAGHDYGGSLRPGRTVRVLTGARIPAGVATIVMEERTSRSESGVTFHMMPDMAANIRRRGEDIAVDTVVVTAGSLIDPRHIAILAACGHVRLRVRRKLRVAVVSSGDELVDAESSPMSSQHVDTNRPMLLSLLASPSIDAVDLGVVGDNRDTLSSLLSDAAEHFDLLISTGGVAGSDADHMQPAVLAAGGRCRTMKLALRPGKPIARGAIGSMQIVALPGNPVAALVNFLLFVRPLARKLIGASNPVQPDVIARTAETFFHKPGRTEFVPAALAGHDAEGAPRLNKLSRGGSARLLPLIHAHGLAEIPPHVGDLTEGAPIKFHPFTASFAL